MGQGGRFCYGAAGAPGGASVARAPTFAHGQVTLDGLGAPDLG